MRPGPNDGMIRELDERRSSLNIRFAQRSDLAALLRLENTCFDTDRLSRRSLLHFTRPAPDAAHPHLFLVTEADDHGEIIADALLLGRRSARGAWSATGRLYTLAVAPDYRGQRIALRLVEALLAAAGERGVQRIRLEVDPDNAPALALYRSLGFKEIQALPDYYQNARPALRLEHDLTPFGTSEPEPHTK